MSFKKGQRVIVYDSRLKGLRQTAAVILLRDPNGYNKKALLLEGVVRIDIDGELYSELIVHPKQCRKIREKV